MGTSGFPENMLWNKMPMGSVTLTDLFFITQIVPYFFFFHFTMRIDTKHRHKRCKLMLINLLLVNEDIRDKLMFVFCF